MPLSFNWTLNVITGTFTNAPAPTSVDIAPRDFALDATGDLQVLNGDLVMNYGTEGIASDLRSRLQTFLGECFLDTSLGVPWFEKILGKKTPSGELKSIFRQVILGTPGITAVETLDAAVANRTLTVVFRATAATGDTLEAALGINLGGT